MLDIETILARHIGRAHIRRSALQRYKTTSWLHLRTKLALLAEIHPTDSWPWAEILLVAGLVSAVAILALATI